VTGSIEPTGARREATAGRSRHPDAAAPAADDPLRAERRATRTWWDEQAPAYQAEHGGFLGDARFVWGPEGLDEATAALLGPAGSLAGLAVLDLGCGAAQCARWLVTQGAAAVGLDLSAGQLAQSALLDARTGVRVPVVQADAVALPFAAGFFDVVCSSYGALPFVADAAALHREVARVVRTGGRWVFSVPHPVRWAFPDVPGEAGLTAAYPYFDRSPYVETDGDGAVSYVEHHRTLGDHVRDVVGAGFRVVDLVEPAWPAGLDLVWGGWSPLRGRLLPGTLVVSCVRD
jgi:SAM-dependent methyltransferase